MSGPPTDVSPSTLWLKLSAKERPFKLVDFPRKGMDNEPTGQLAIRVLTQEEQMMCTSSAEKFARGILKEGTREHFGYERLYSDAVCVEMLFYACRDPDDLKKPAFPGPKEMRKMLTTEECAKLFEHYLTVQLELGPTVASMSDEECEAWIDKLVEGGSYYPLDVCSPDSVKLLVMYMAFQLRNSLTDKFSAGLHPDSEAGPISESGLPALTE